MDTVSAQAQQHNGRRRLTGREWWLVVVSSMEQIIGAALSTVVGVMLPLMQLLMHPELSSVMQGIIGAVGLVGIAVGSPVIGKLADKQGYVHWFRICPLLIMAGAAICWLVPGVPALITGLFICGVGVGGGYSLDSAYISELLPKQWEQVLVGLAKATCALGFIGGAAICWVVLKADPNAHIWRSLILIIGISAAITLLMRIHWANSPKWLIDHGRIDEARKAVGVFYGKNPPMQFADICAQGTGTAKAAASDKANADAASNADAAVKAVSLPVHGSGGKAMNDGGITLRKVIYSGIPWACEGLGVYGFGVFLPVLVMTLGLDETTAKGIEKVVNSVELTAVVNFFILPGFVLGLLMVGKVSDLKMLTWGFVGSAIGLGMLLAGYAMHLPKWEMILGFIIFEVALNAGPHIITYIIPTKIYSVEDRSTGNGIANMLGKSGAILGVLIMPILIEMGGAVLVLVVSIAVMLLGALIARLSGGGGLKAASPLAKRLH